MKVDRCETVKSTHKLCPKGDLALFNVSAAKGLLRYSLSLFQGASLNSVSRIR